MKDVICRWKKTELWRGTAAALCLAAIVWGIFIAGRAALYPPALPNLIEHLGMGVLGALVSVGTLRQLDKDLRRNA